MCPLFPSQPVEGLLNSRFLLPVTGTCLLLYVTGCEMVSLSDFLVFSVQEMKWNQYELYIN